MLFSYTHAAVTVALDNMGIPVLAGTSRSLVCSVPQELSVTLSWMKNGNPVSSNSRVTLTTNSTTTSTLMFNPLHTSDGGKYQCIIAMIGGANFDEEINLNVTSELLQLAEHMQAMIMIIV